MSRRTLCAIALSSFAVFLAGCFEAGVGDPATAPAEVRLEGIWQASDETQMFLVKAWDGHTYSISAMKVEPVPGGGARTFEVGRVYKGWLAKIGDKTFLTMDSTPGDIVPAERPYLVAAIEFQGNDLVTRAVDVDKCKGLKTTAAMEQRVKENLNNPEFYAKEPTIYKRVTDQVQKERGPG